MTPGPELRVPQSFRHMPRWWRGGSGWLDRLPALVADRCARWRLTPSSPAPGIASAI